LSKPMPLFRSVIFSFFAMSFLPAAGPSA